MANIGRQLTSGFFAKQVLSPDGVETNFILDYPVTTTTGLLVVEDGSIKEPDADYSLVSSTEIAFSVAPTGSVLYVIFLGREISTVPLNISRVYDNWDQDAQSNLVPLVPRDVGTTTKPVKDIITSGDIRVGGTLHVFGEISQTPVTLEELHISDDKVLLLSDAIVAPPAGVYGMIINDVGNIALPGAAIVYDTADQKWKAGREDDLHELIFDFDYYSTETTVDDTDSLLIKESGGTYKNISFQDLSSTLIGTLNPLNNDEYWSGKKVGDVVTEKLIGVNTSDQVVVGGETLDLIIRNGTRELLYDATGLVPQSSGQSLGSSVNQFSTVHANQLSSTGTTLQVTSTTSIQIDAQSSVTYNTKSAHYFKYFNTNYYIIEDNSGSGTFRPAANLTHDLGEPTYAFSSVYTNLLSNPTGSALHVGTLDAQDLYLKSNNIDRWLVDTAGHFRPTSVSGSYNIGSLTTYIGYTYTAIVSGPSTLQCVAPSGNLTLESTNNRVYIDAGDDIWLQATDSIIVAPGGANRWAFYSGGEFSPYVDNAYDIGTPSFRVRVAYINEVQSAHHLYLDSGTGDIFIRSDDRVLFYTSGVARWYVHDTSGHFYPWSTSTYDIGSGSNWVRGLYADNVYIQSGPTLSGSGLDMNNHAITDISSIAVNSGPFIYNGGIDMNGDNITEVGQISINFGPSIGSSGIDMNNDTIWDCSEIQINSGPNIGSSGIDMNGKDIYDCDDITCDKVDANEIHSPLVWNGNGGMQIGAGNAALVQIGSSNSVMLYNGAANVQFTNTNVWRPGTDMLCNLGSSTIKWNGLNVYTIGQPSTTGNAAVVYSDSYQSFTGHHLYQYEGTLESGDAVRLENGKIVKCDSAYDKRCVGIYECDFEFADSDVPIVDSLKVTVALPATLANVAAVGDSRTSNNVGLKVCDEGGPVEYGDLLTTSSVPGYLMKQDDDLHHSYTVAKAAEDVVFDVNGKAEGIYGFIYCG